MREPNPNGNLVKELKIPNEEHMTTIKLPLKNRHFVF